MKVNIRGQLNIIRSLGMKPNYSELSREYGLDRHTIAKYDKGYKGKSKTRNKPSDLDKYKEDIKNKLNIKGTTIKGVYEYMKDKYEDISTYSNFYKYVMKHDLKPKRKTKASPRFETGKGVQLQFDWKESIKMISKYGEIFEFNIFNATLGHSRLHNFVYSKTKTKEDVIRCLIDTFDVIGGVPKECLTDNMSSIVNTHTKKFDNHFLQFAKDIGFTAKRCKPRAAKTKGKVESSNRFVAWLFSYNHDFEDEAHLIKIIKHINDKSNDEINQTTKVKPILLFEKEKEYLKPLPNSKIIDSYLDNLTSKRVSSESLLYYKGNRYSVPIKFIDKTLKIKELQNKLYVYNNRDLITIHDISDKNINYKKDHYTEAIKDVIKYKSDDEIENIVNSNLLLLDNL